MHTSGLENKITVIVACLMVSFSVLFVINGYDTLFWSFYVISSLVVDNPRGAGIIHGLKSFDM